MHRTAPASRVLLTLLTGAALTLGTPALAHAKPPSGGGTSTTTTIATAYAGRAYGISLAATALVNLVKLGPVVVSDTGELPASGGESDASLLGVNVPLGGVTATADVVDAVTVGSGLTTDSNASTVAATANVDGLLSLNAGVLQAQATATCPTTGTTPIFGGHANLANVALNLLGQNVVIPLNPAPNTTLNLLNGVVKLVLNEQYVSNGRMNVNALHLTVNGPLSVLSSVATADLVISHADAGITCGTTTSGGGGGGCPVTDFITGGGQVTSSTGASVSFAVHGGLRSGGFWGRFNAVDHSTSPGSHLTGATVTNYEITGPTSRRITYDNGALVVNAADNGEPGTSDTISFASYSGNPITHGNIQLHKPAGCSTSSTTTPGGKRH